MRTDAIPVEERRLEGIKDIEDYPWFKERHRIFPAIFEQRGHKKILDMSAGVGCAARRIRDHYPAELICNDITPTCLRILEQQNLNTVSFDLDNDQESYPFPDGHFDAVVSLVTIEHLLNIDHFVKEVRRILCDGGYFYISTPNYAALEYATRFLISGKAFHDPLSSEEDRYEFYAHVRYFTYKTLLEFISSFGFVAQAVYIAMPGGSSKYKELYAASKFKALTVKYLMWLRHKTLPARWASEPVICFQKTTSKSTGKVRKVVL